MKRTLLTTVATVIAFGTAPAIASDYSRELKSDSPQVLGGGNDNAVASGGAPEYDTNSPRITNGTAAIDPVTGGISAKEAGFIEQAAGANLETVDGQILGVIEKVTYSAQGNPELRVDLVDDTKFTVEKLVITTFPEAVSIENGQVYLDASLDEMFLKSKSGVVRDDETAHISLM